MIEIAIYAILTVGVKVTARNAGKCTPWSLAHLLSTCVRNKFRYSSVGQK
jgi:hypothetical protein